MNYLIADSGATKAEWRLAGDSPGQTVQTEGLNPYYHSAESIAKVLNEELIPEIDQGAIGEIFFYGAGCDSSEKNKVVHKALQKCFPNAKPHIFHDLLGAARACFLNEAGIACILGTGSNSCLYDGKKIVEHIPSLAFILGDEGSAGYFGKKLINSYFRQELPHELAAELERTYNMELDYIMKGLYDKPQKSRFIASYSSFLGKHKTHPFIGNMLQEGFEQFITSIIKKYSDAKSYKVSFVGSVACAYEELISEMLLEHNLQAGRFIQKPLDRLVAFHIQRKEPNNE